MTVLTVYIESPYALRYKGFFRKELFMEKDTEHKEMEELSEEELQEFMSSYKKELAHIYKMASAKKTFMARSHMPCLRAALEQCDRDMRKDIEELKHKYGIHY